MSGVAAPAVVGETGGGGGVRSGDIKFAGSVADTPIVDSKQGTPDDSSPAHRRLGDKALRRQLRRA